MQPCHNKIVCVFKGILQFVAALQRAAQLKAIFCCFTCFLLLIEAFFSNI